MLIRSKKFLLLLFTALLVIPLLTACGGGNKVNVSLSSFTIQMPSSLKAGTVTFHVANIDTAVTHEFVIFKTDLSPDKLPLNSDGTVNEQGQGLTHIDEVSDLAPGASQDLTPTLQPGNYIALCNLPGYFKAGMYTVFTVK
jgi:uncharacterized cupredoxin-like copper-binding protein